jgi:hypothetical protein
MLLQSANKLLETVPFFAVKSFSYVALYFRTSTTGKTVKGPNCIQNRQYMTLLTDFVAGNTFPEFILLH